MKFYNPMQSLRDALLELPESERNEFADKVASMAGIMHSNSGPNPGDFEWHVDRAVQYLLSARNAIETTARWEQERKERFELNRANPHDFVSIMPRFEVCTRCGESADFPMHRPA